MNESTVKPGLSERMGSLSPAYCPSMGKENYITKIIKEMSETPIYSYMYGFREDFCTIGELYFDATNDGIDTFKTTYLDIAKVAYKWFQSDDTREQSVKMICALTKPLLTNVRALKTYMKKHESEEMIAAEKMLCEQFPKDFEGRIAFTKFTTPKRPPIADINIEHYLVGICNFSENSKLLSYYKEIIEPYGGYSVEGIIRYDLRSLGDSHEEDSPTFAELDLCNLMLLPFIVYNNVKTSINNKPQSSLKKGCDIND